MTAQVLEANQSLEVRLAEWQQGDFSLGCGDFLFRDVPGSNDGEEDESEVVLDSAIEGFVVISQTCDIVRNPEIIPHVSTCPLIKIDEERVSDIERGQAPRYGLLSNTPEGLVVDFSRTMSVSKELLVTWDRQRGCEDEAAQLHFARNLENFFGRFAYPDSFVESVSSLRKAVFSKYRKDQSEFGQAVRSIRELRVFPHASWNDNKSVPVTFILVLDDENHREVKDRETIHKHVAPKILGIEWKAPFSLHKDGIYLTTLNDLTAAEYLNSFPLDVNSLSFARRYQKAD